MAEHPLRHRPRCRGEALAHLEDGGIVLRSCRSCRGLVDSLLEAWEKLGRG